MFYRRRNQQYDENGFFENSTNHDDPVVVYSHDGCWHAPGGYTSRRSSTAVRGQTPSLANLGFLKIFFL